MPVLVSLWKGREGFLLIILENNHENFLERSQLEDGKVLFLAD